MVYFLTDASVDYVEEAMDHVNDFYNMDDREYFRESSVASSMDFERENRLKLKELNRFWALEAYRGLEEAGGKLASVKKAYRKGVKKVTSWFVGDLVHQQVDFNSSVVSYLNFLHEHSIEPRQSFPGAWYLKFEEKFHPQTKKDTAQLEKYVDFFKERKSSRNVVDLGCGRGEFLGLLSRAGIGAQGVDLSTSMVKCCTQKGYDVKRKDCVVFLKEFHDNSLGGVFASHLIETMSQDDLYRLLFYSYRRLERGGRLIIETANPQSLAIFSEGFYKNPFNVRPVDPEALQFLLEQAGFTVDETGFINGFEKEQQIQVTKDMDRGTRQLAEQLNRKLYGPRDYYMVCTK